jgi:hypothetical protein
VTVLYFVAFNIRDPVPIVMPSDIGMAKVDVAPSERARSDDLDVRL